MKAKVALQYGLTIKRMFGEKVAVRPRHYARNAYLTVRIA